MGKNLKYVKNKKGVKIPNVRIGLRSNHIFQLNSMIGATLLLTFTLNYGQNILVRVSDFEL